MQNRWEHTETFTIDQAILIALNRDETTTETKGFIDLQAFKDFAYRHMPTLLIADLLNKISFEYNPELLPDPHIQALIAKAQKIQTYIDIPKQGLMLSLSGKPLPLDHTSLHQAILDGKSIYDQISFAEQLHTGLIDLLNVGTFFQHGDYLHDFSESTNTKLTRAGLYKWLCYKRLNHIATRFKPKSPNQLDNHEYDDIILHRNDELMDAIKPRNWEHTSYFSINDVIDITLQADQSSTWAKLIDSDSVANYKKARQTLLLELELRYQNNPIPSAQDDDIRRYHNGDLYLTRHGLYEWLLYKELSDIAQQFKPQTYIDELTRLHREIEQLKQENTQLQEENQQFKRDDNTLNYPISLSIAESVYKEVWRDWNSETTQKPTKNQLIHLIQKKGITENGSIDSIIKITTPDSIRLGGTPDPLKAKWKPKYVIK